MPTYTYRCNACGHEFEARQRFSDDPLTDCPSCEGDVRRVVNSVGIVFKGSGFYVTDNRNGTAPGKSADGADAGAASEKPVAGEGKETPAKKSTESSKKSETSA